jgi:hypothetical protein
MSGTVSPSFLVEGPPLDASATLPEARAIPFASASDDPRTLGDPIYFAIQQRRFTAEDAGRLLVGMARHRSACPL